MADERLKHRMSSIQREVLTSLFLLGKKLEGPISVSDLRRILNKNRRDQGLTELYVSNFSVSCKTLCKRGFLLKFRNPSTLSVAYALTEKGVNEGKKEYMKILENIVQ